MKKILTALAGLALAGAAVLVPASPAAAISCQATVDTPYKLSSGAVIGAGHMECTGGTGNLSIRAYLSRTGTQVDYTDHYCSGAFDCTAFTSYADSSGGQTWCTWAVAYVQGTAVDWSSTKCESASW